MRTMPWIPRFLSRSLYGSLLCLTLAALSATAARGDFDWRCSSPGETIICDGGNTCVEIVIDGVGMGGALCCGGGSCSCTNLRAGPINIGFDDALDTALQTGRLHSAGHQRPMLPVVLDGLEYAPEELGRFDGRPLHFLVTRESIEQGLIYGFWSQDELIVHLAENDPTPRAQLPAEGLPQGSSGVLVYEDAKWAGPFNFVPAGLALELDTTWWNGKISSLRGTGAPTLVTLFEAPRFGGSSITLTTYPLWPRLEIFGWQDRAASLMVWPLPPAEEPFETWPATLVPPGR